MKVLFKYQHKFESEYSDTSPVYEYKLDEETVKELTEKTNRSKNQTQFLFNLLDGDLQKLKQLENQLKNCLVSYCPSDKEEVEKVFSLQPFLTKDLF